MTDAVTNDYIEYFMWKHENQMTVREIAEILGIRKETVYAIAKAYGIQTKSRTLAKKADCKNRPVACFNCPAVDCRCPDTANKKEAEFVDLCK